MQQVNIDIIILSYAKNEELKELTEQTISSLMASEDPADVRFNIVVIESNKNLTPFQFDHTLTIYPEVRFGYNRYMNIGIKATSNPYVCLCNNDLIFHKNWATNILNQMHLDADLKSVSPYCDINHKNGIADDGKNMVSTINGILIGWCIFLKREILEVTGYLDENFEFWYADNDYGKTLEKHHIKHALVTSSKVTHIGSKTHSILNESALFEQTYGQYLYYNLKWNKTFILLYYIKKILMPVFKYAYINRSKSSVHMTVCRLLSKLYGGLR